MNIATLPSSSSSVPGKQAVCRVGGIVRRETSVCSRERCSARAARSRLKGNNACHKVFLNRRHYVGRWSRLLFDGVGRRKEKPQEIAAEPLFYGYPTWGCRVGEGEESGGELEWGEEEGKGRR